AAAAIRRFSCRWSRNGHRLPLRATPIGGSDTLTAARGQSLYRCRLRAASTPRRYPAMTITLVRRSAAIAVAVLCAACLQPALAEGPVLKPSQVTENALVDALEIDPGPQEATGATRSIRPTMRPSEAHKTAAGPGKANLLITFATGSAELTPETIQTLEVV